MEPEPTPFLNLETRRSFLKKSAVAAAAVAGGRLISYAQTAPGNGTAPALGSRTYNSPWYTNALRWGQTDITEADPIRYDIPWWRTEWQNTRIQGVIINAGGIVAYYLTQVVLHREAEFLNGLDVFGSVADAARKDGLAVLARLDSGGANAEFYHARPDLFSVDINNQPYILRDLYVPCINGPYFSQFIPTVIREIVSKYKSRGYPDGFIDNNWSGLPRQYICYCENCRTLFKAKTGYNLPLKKDWEDTVYRAWIIWNYGTRLDRWDQNNSITKAAGGPDCLWVGVTDGSVTNEAENFRDLREICHRSQIVMRNDQRRHDATGFQINGEAGKLIHAMLGWNKSIIESIAMFDQTDAQFRLVSKPEPEVRLWAVDGFAGGSQPCWHYIGAYGEDARMYPTPVAPFKWHSLHDRYLINRTPIATVGVVWSQLNNDFFGRDDPELMVNLPQRGITQALIRARIPYVMIHADDIPLAPGPPGIPGSLRLLILPNLGVMTTKQVYNVRAFVKAGGSLFATGLTSLFDQWGDPLTNFALGDLFHSTLAEQADVRQEPARVAAASEAVHSYLRLTPELHASMEGAPKNAEPRHPVLNGFDDTDIIAFGGTLYPSAVDPEITIKPLTYVTPPPTTPPEEVWLRDPSTDANALVLSEVSGRSRVAYLPADIDRRYAKENLPDHAKLLTNIVNWAVIDDPPLLVSGPGFIDCHLYYQLGLPGLPSRFTQPIQDAHSKCVILHLVNLTNAGTWRGPVEEIIPVGPIVVRVQLPPDIIGINLHLLVADKDIDFTRDGNWFTFALDSLIDHEVAVIS